MSLLSIFKRKYSRSTVKGQKDVEAVVWKGSSISGEVMKKGSASEFLLSEAKRDSYFRCEMASEPFVEFVFEMYNVHKEPMLERQWKGVLSHLSLKEDSPSNKDFFSLFENWDLVFEESRLPIHLKFSFLLKIMPALKKEAIALMSDLTEDGHKKLNNVIFSPGFNALCLFIDDVLSEYGYERAYHEKSFKSAYEDFIPILERNYLLGGGKYYPQSVHFLYLKSKNFSRNYNFLSDVSVGKDDGFIKYIGVTCALQSDLYKFSNLVFFSIEDLEKMYNFASNYFADNSLIVTTRVADGTTHTGQMRIIDERKSFIFDYEKIRGHMNFPDMFHAIMKDSYMQALNDVVSKQMQYKMKVDDAIEDKKLNEENTLKSPFNKPDEDLKFRLDSFLKFTCREMDFNYEEAIKDKEFLEMRECFLKGVDAPDNRWLLNFKDVSCEPWKQKRLSNILRYLVFTNLESKYIGPLVKAFLLNLRDYESDLQVFDGISFDVRKSRVRVIQELIKYNKEWLNNPEKYIIGYLGYEFRKNKIFPEDDFICTKVMDSLFEKWNYCYNNDKKNEAYSLAIHIKDFYSLVILNSSSEYENDFWEKYSVAVDRIYQEYVFEKNGEKGTAEIVLVSNFDVKKFWSNKENKSISIKKVWAALKKIKASKPFLDKVFPNKDLYIKYDNEVGRGVCYNDVYSVIMSFDSNQEHLFNRLIPKWFKHCIESNEITFERLEGIIESGKVAKVSD